MRYVYAVILPAEAAELSSQLPQSLLFTNYIDVDGYFIDAGNSRRERGALLRTVKPNDQVVIESRSSCGMDTEEVDDLEHHLLEKKARLTCAIESDEIVPDTSVPIAESAHDEARTTTPAPKHRRKLRVNIDPVLFAKLYQELKAGKIKKKEMAEKVGLSYTALNNRIQRYEQIGE